jgi:hypothetical protein
MLSERNRTIPQRLKLSLRALLPHLMPIRIIIRFSKQEDVNAAVPAVADVDARGYQVS